jgi:hypothetical protein
MWDSSKFSAASNASSMLARSPITADSRSLAGAL